MSSWGNRSRGRSRVAANREMHAILGQGRSENASVTVVERLDPNAGEKAVNRLASSLSISTTKASAPSGSDVEERVEALEGTCETLYTATLGVDSVARKVDAAEGKVDTLVIELAQALKTVAASSRRAYATTTADVKVFAEPSESATRTGTHATGSRVVILDNFVDVETAKGLARYVQTEDIDSATGERSGGWVVAQFTAKGSTNTVHNLKDFEL